MLQKIASLALIAPALVGCAVIAEAATSAPVLCRALGTSPSTTITITPNTSGECSFDRFGPQTVPCDADQSMHVEVELNGEIEDKTFLLQCTLVNPESPEDDPVGCYHPAPSGCLAFIDNFAAFDADDNQLEEDFGFDSFGCNWQPTGESHPLRKQFFLEEIGTVISNLEYCIGLQQEPTPENLQFVPWAQGRCCREHLDQFFFVTPISGARRLSFDIRSPVKATHGYDWRFVIPSCGDGVRSCGEECDDGNTSDLDSCSSACEVRSGGCGLPVTGPGGEANTSDALLTLRSAIGIVSCGLCVCDVDGNGVVTSTDSLRVLRRAVDLPVQLNCSACPRLFNTLSDYDPYLESFYVLPAVCESEFKCGFPTNEQSSACTFEIPEPVFGCCACAGSPTVVESPYDCLSSSQF